MSRATRGRAVTSPAAADRRLRGRTSAVPFQHVWQAACTLAGGGLRGWSLAGQDDDAGIITAHANALIGDGHHVVIRIGLDENAQTRVDAEADAISPAADFGRAARCLHRFFTALDQSLARQPPRGVGHR
ncbi:MAG: hypothetical protein WD054_05570 [Gemmatimonadota bacterium]